jgi:hypothetical protein
MGVWDGLENIDGKKSQDKDIEKESGVPCVIKFS